MKTKEELMRIMAGYAVGIYTALQEKEGDAAVGGILQLMAVSLMEAGIKPEEMTSSYIKTLERETLAYGVENPSSSVKYTIKLMETFGKKA